MAGICKFNSRIPLLLARNIAGRSRSLSSSSKDPSDTNTPTHTGQFWEDDDIRNNRFKLVPRQTNTKWGIDLIQEVPPIAVKGRTAVCDGGPSESLGHPKIYINLDEPGNHSCIYCGLRFFKESSH